MYDMYNFSCNDHIFIYEVICHMKSNVKSLFHEVININDMSIYIFYEIYFVGAGIALWNCKLTLR